MTESTNESPSALEVEDLHKRFGKVQALAGVSLKVRLGEQLALLGPNGAGKTTLVRCLSGWALPDSGRMKLLGEELPRRGGRNQLGLVPQEIAIYPALTARENLQVFGKLHGLKGTDLQERVEWALKWTGLEERANSMTKRFSGGMRRRVNIACGVLHRPQVLLLDEPTVGVDPQSRERIYDMLAELRDQGTTILLTTHHLDEAERRCDRIVILDHGKVIADGTLSELIEKTVGSQRQVTVEVSEVPRDVPNDWQLDESTRTLRALVQDVGRELAEVLQCLRDQGLRIEDISLQNPSLHAVFIHLTGRELRE